MRHLGFVFAAGVFLFFFPVMLLWINFTVAFYRCAFSDFAASSRAVTECAFQALVR